MADIRNLSVGENSRFPRTVTQETPERKQRFLPFDYLTKRPGLFNNCKNVLSASYNVRAPESCADAAFSGTLTVYWRLPYRRVKVAVQESVYV